MNPLALFFWIYVAVLVLGFMVAGWMDADLEDFIMPLLLWPVMVPIVVSVLPFMALYGLAGMAREAWDRR